jgi:hypothetical protein
MLACDKKSTVGGGATIKDLDADLAKLIIGAAQMRVLVYTLVSGIEHAGMDDTRVTTAYINLDNIKQDSAFMTFARKHLPSGVGHINSVYKRDAEEYDTRYRWYTAVNDSPVDFDLEEEVEAEPANIDAMIEELNEVGGTLVPPLGFVQYAITATFISVH